MSVPDWMKQAACLDYDPNLWFPDKETPAGSRALARQVCLECPVRAQCLERALGLGAVTDYGMWAGHTKHYLRNLRTKARRD